MTIWEDWVKKNGRTNIICKFYEGECSKCVLLPICSVPETYLKERYLDDEIPDTKNWIPITERLPEERGEYLITTTDGRVDKCFFIGKGENHFFGMHEYVTAWMPLPKPYEEGQNDADNSNCRP